MEPKSQKRNHQKQKDLLLGSGHPQCTDTRFSSTRLESRQGKYARKLRHRREEKVFTQQSCRRPKLFLEDLWSTRDRLSRTSSMTDRSIRDQTNQNITPTAHMICKILPWRIIHDHQPRQRMESTHITPPPLPRTHLQTRKPDQSARNRKECIDKRSRITLSLTTTSKWTKLLKCYWY